MWSPACAKTIPMAARVEFRLRDLNRPSGAINQKTELARNRAARTAATNSTPIGREDAPSHVKQTQQEPWPPLRRTADRCRCAPARACSPPELQRPVAEVGQPLVLAHLRATGATGACWSSARRASHARVTPTPLRPRVARQSRRFRTLCSSRRTMRRLRR